MNRARHMSESRVVAVILAAAGGFLDAYSFLCRGRVFANAQTGNIVQMGIAAFEGRWIDFVRFVVPVIMFALGVLLAEEMHKHFSLNGPVHWRQLVLAVEIAALAAAAFIPSGKYDTAANVIISFVCALQTQSFRKVGSVNFSSTMCTGNLRTASENVFRYVQTGEKGDLATAGVLFAVIGCFTAGAAAGAAASSLGTRSVLISAGIMCIAFLIMLADGRGKETVQEIN